MQSRSQHGHQKAVVNVTQQLGFNGGMSDLKMTVSYLFITHVEERLRYLGDSTAEVKGVQKVDQSWNLKTPRSKLSSIFLDSQCTTVMVVLALAHSINSKDRCPPQAAQSPVASRPHPDNASLHCKPAVGPEGRSTGQTGLWPAPVNTQTQMDPNKC